MVHAIAAQDGQALRSLFATPVVFRAVTPRRFWDAETPWGISDIVLGVWFDPTKTVTAITSLEAGALGDTRKIGYAMAVDLPTGPAVIEQVAYYSEQEGLITQMRLVCSGFLPV
jgi:hypothetical protein